MGTRERMAAALTAFERDRAARVLVIRGAGARFCAGGDVKALAAGDANTPQQRLERMRDLHPLINGLAQLDRPVIAAVDGAAFGAGFGLALLDRRRRPQRRRQVDPAARDRRPAALQRPGRAARARAA